MGGKRGATNFIERSDFAKFFESEALLQQSVAALLTRIPGTRAVQITHGPMEHGKDITFFSKSGLGEEILCACILKNTKISGAVASANGARAVLLQAEQAFDTPYLDANGHEHLVQRVYVMTPYEISAASTASVVGALRRDAGRISFCAGSELYDLFARYWPEFVSGEKSKPRKSVTGKPPAKDKDPGPEFFVSYSSPDKDWAEWISWTLEEAGFHTTVQAWDFRPGSNFVLEMQRALERAKRIVLVLSEDYLKSQFTSAEWAGFFARDPAGKERKLLPIRVRDCRPEGLLRALIYLDIIGLSEVDARTAILGALSERAATHRAVISGEAPLGARGFSWYGAH